MYQLEWSQRPSDRILRAGDVWESSIDERTIESVYLMAWEEHCVECAPPDCYDECPLYVRRMDGYCSRFRYGIFPNERFRGLLPFGADIAFRRWGKLQARLEGGFVPVATARRYQRIDRSLVPILRPVARLASPLRRKDRIVTALSRLRQMQVRRHRMGSARLPVIDEFLIEAYNPGPACSIIVECVQDRGRFRASVPLSPGRNVHRIPYESMNVDLVRGGGTIRLYPDRDAEARVVFTWLDFVRYRGAPERAPNRQTPIAPPSAAGRPDPASKVKCVVWDLDNTLWRGILAEDGPERVYLRDEVAALIRQLDERGILLSIASKNDHATAWPVVERMGLGELFLAPQINWGAKSESILSVARALNIGADTIAFIDDSAIERAQVKDALPQVRVFPEDQLGSLLCLPEFDVVVSEESRARRLSYLAEAKRKQVAARFAGSDTEFLRSCELVADLHRPTGALVERSLELLQRSNQLNLTTYRYDERGLRELLEDPRVMTFAIACSDRFGDYGTIGFASVDLSAEVPLLKDFVMSCRVAQKKVEHAWFRWLVALLAERGHRKLRARFVPTARNAALREILIEVGFIVVGTEEGAPLLELDAAHAVPDSDIVAIRDRTGSRSRTAAGA